MFTVAVFLAVLVALVVVHEFGHFITAKLSRVTVLEFGVGFPPRLFGVRWGGTLYSLNLLPLGGFVRLAGESDPNEPGSLASRSPLTRLVILAAGSGMNVLLPLVLFAVFFMVPQQVVATDVVILDVAPNSPGERAAVQPGDVIRTVDGQDVANSAELRAAILLRLGADSRWVLQRADRLLEVRLTPRVSPPEGQGAAGVAVADARVSVASLGGAPPADRAGLLPGDLLVVVGGSRVLSAESVSQAIARVQDLTPGEPAPVQVLRDGALVELALPPALLAADRVELAVRPEERRSEPLWQAVSSSVRQTGQTLVLFKNEVSRWIGGSRPQLAGPIGIAQITGDAARGGVSPLLFWTALLSLNLAIINLLPIPMLDGGRILFVLLELVRGGRRISAERERLVHLIGFVALMGLIVAVSLNDISRLIGGDNLSGR